jgi:hypothetical protein
MAVQQALFGDVLTALGGDIGGKLVNGMTSAVIAGPLRAAVYGYNLATASLVPLIPDVSTLLWLGATRQLTTESMWDQLKCHGVANDGMWQRVFANAQVWPDPNVALAAFRRGMITQEEMTAYIKQAGWYDPDARRLLMHPPWRWTVNEIRTLSETLNWSDAFTEQMLSSCGMSREIDQEWYDSLYTPPSPFETLQLLNRGVIEDSLAEDWLILSGMTHPNVRLAFRHLRHQIPSPSELIRFSVKEVWNAQVVRDLGYDDEFDQIPAFRHWMEKQGYGGSPAVMGLGDGQPTTWAQAFWRAHWETISNTQAYNMLHRLRPTGGLQGGPPGSGSEAPRIPEIGGRPIKPMTMADVAEVLKINDYPPIWRERLAAISYLPLRLVDINRIVYLCLKDEEFKAATMPDSWTVEQWASEEFQDRGQTKRQADLLARLAVDRAAAQRHRDHIRETRMMRTGRTGLVLRQYSNGTITREDAYTRLRNLGLNRAVIEAWLDERDARKKLEDLRFQVGWLQKHVLKGQMSLAEAGTWLNRLGLVASEVTRYLNRWRFELDAGLKMEVTDQILREYERGRISHGQAYARLETLGWSGIEELLAGTVVSSGLGSLGS